MFSKKFFLLFLILYGFNSSQAQISVISGVSAIDLIDDLLDTTGSTLSVSNITLNCDSSAYGIFTGPSNLGLDNGIVLSSGKANSFIYHTLGQNSDSLGTNGDSDLTSVAQVSTHDACVLEFDFTPFGDTVIYKYVFTSREYPSFNCSNFNDVFAFYISGPGFNNPTNVALLPNSNIPVTINNVNDQSSLFCGDSNFFVKNFDTFLSTQGFTIPLLVKAPVNNGQQYHLKIAIADANDAILNSHVFLGRKSLLCKKARPSAVNSKSLMKDIKIFPTLFDNEINILDSKNKIEGLDIFTSTGSWVLHSEIKSSKKQHTISLQQLPKGMYFISFMDKLNSRISTSKIIKK